MAEETRTPALKKRASHIRTSTRRQGIRLSKEQRLEAQEVFLKTFSLTGNVRASCMKAGIDRSAVRQWEEHDTAFSVLYEQAKLDVNDLVDAEIFHRGMQGEERFVTSMGKVVYHDGKPLTIKEKSDTLLMFMAKARMPEKYRDKSSVDLTANVSSHVTQSGSLTLNMRDLSPTELEQVKMVAKSMKERQGEKP